MGKIVFECENISVDMAGANLNQQELRPASFKGVMRFWWRAMNGDLNLKELTKQEDKIFGSTEKKSSFSIKMKRYQGIPTNFKIEFILSPGCDLDIENFFKTVVLLGGFGKSAKKQEKGKIKIVSVKRDDGEWIEYRHPNSLNNILKLLGDKFEIQNNEIISKNFKFNYPMVHKIWIDNGVLKTKLKEDKIFQRELNV
jgi:CRISPR type III-B/RAMP module RAMP protein Cmr1